MNAPDEGPIPGMAIERTALAWQRTCISIISVGVLAVRWSMVEHLPVWPGIVVTALASVSSLIVVDGRYRRMRDSVRAGQPPYSRYLVPAAAGFAVAVVIGVGAGIVAEYSAL
jgi:uncharacterized membrane protein YidH (DUF202 family)